MNRRAESDLGDLLKENFIYLLFVILFTVGMVTYVYSVRNNAGVWEDFYAKELAKSINYAQAGDTLTIDIQDITNIAMDNKIRDFNSLFSVNSEKQQICVGLSTGGKSCFSYFNDVRISQLSVKTGVPGNVLVIKLEGGST